MIRRAVHVLVVSGLVNAAVVRCARVVVWLSWSGEMREPQGREAVRFGLYVEVFGFDLHPSARAPARAWQR